MWLLGAEAIMLKGAVVTAMAQKVNPEGGYLRV